MHPVVSRLWPFVRDQYGQLLAATRFLSILVLPGSKFFDARGATGASPLRGSAYFPLVGLLLASLLCLLLVLLTPLLPHLVLAALLVVALVALTGGLHLDGLMDSCDGLFGGFTRERKLEIMRDSRVGSFGVLGGACSLLLRFACFASLSARDLPMVLLIALPASRWSMLLALRTFPMARESGLGATFRQTVTLRDLVVAGVFSLILALLGAQLVGLLAEGVMTLLALGVGLWMTRQLGGLTGDTLGAIVELTELAGLVLFLLFRF